MEESFKHITVVLTCGTGSEEFLVTGDTSNNINIRNIQTDEILTAKTGGSICSICIDGSLIYVGTEFGDIEAYSLQTGNFVTLINAFWDPVTYLSCSAKYMFAVTGETYIKSWIRSNFTIKCKDLTTARARVHSVVISPDNSFLAASIFFGTLSIWNIIDEAFTKLQEIKYVVNDFDRNLKLHVNVLFSWSKKNELALPGKNAVYIYKLGEGKHLKIGRSKPVDKFVLVNIINYKTGIEEQCTIAQFSKSGKYLACGSLSGTILVWMFKKTEIVFQQIGIFGSIKQILFTNIETDLHVLHNGKIAKITNFLKIEQRNQMFYNKNFSKNALRKATVFKDLTEKMNLVPTSKKSIAIETSNKFLQSNTMLSKDFNRRVQQRALLLPEANNNSCLFSKCFEESNVTKAMDFDETSKSVARELKPKYELERMDSCVHKFSKIMIWNRFGFVERQDSFLFIHSNHNINSQRTYIYENRQNFNVVSLCENFVVLANSGSVNKGTVQRYLFSLTQIDWCITLPRYEYTLGLAIGSKWIAACSNVKKIRIFDHDGKQRHIIDVGQTVEFVVGLNDILCFTSCTQWTSNFAEHFCSVYKFSSIHLIEEQRSFSRIPLSEESAVKWIGFTDEGNPTISDSRNSVFVLKCFWTEIFDSNLSKIRYNKNISLQGVNETTKTIRFYDCSRSLIPQKNKSNRLLSTEKFHVPKCKLNSENPNRKKQFKKPLREDPDNVKNFLTKNNRTKTESQLSDAVSHLFQVACETGNDLIARKCMETFYDQVNTNKLFEIAATYKRNSLMTKLQQIAPNGSSSSFNEGHTSGMKSFNSDWQFSACGRRKINRKNISIPKTFDVNEARSARKELRRKIFLRSLMLKTTTKRFDSFQVANKLKRAAMWQLQWH